MTIIFKLPPELSINIRKKVTKARTREESFINTVETSETYLRYMSSENEFSISEYEFCDLLFCALESPNEVRKKNLAFLKDYASRLERQEITQFLDYLETFYKHYLTKPSDEKLAKYKGGMFKKKVKRRGKKDG